MRAIIIILNLISIGLLLDRDIFFTDFDGQWRLCAYALRAVDPYPIIGLEPPPCPDVGVIPNGWGTSPWGLLLGNFFYAGFLPLDAARIYFLIFNAILLVATVRAAYVETNRDARTLIIFGCPASFVISTCTGNAGAMICSLLLLSCLTCERRPRLAAFMLSLAMVKPQVALAFCVMFLIRRRLQVLVLAAVIDITAWIIAARIVERTPIELLQEFFRANVGGGSQFSGVFTLLVDNHMHSIALSMALGIVFMWRLRAEGFVAPCLASAFWSYSYFNEFYLLTLPTLRCVRAEMFASAIILHVGETLWTSFALWHRRMLELGAAPVDSTLLESMFALESWFFVRTFFCLTIIAIGFELRRRTPREC